MQIGIFKFYMDGIDQNVPNDVLTSGMWQDETREVDEGFHKFEWIYQRYINFGDSYSMEDLAAEIEYVQVRGVYNAVREC